MPEQGLARSECSMRGPSKTWFLLRAYSSFLVLWLQLLSTTQQLHFLPSPCPCSGSLPHTHRCFQILRSELSFAFSLKARSPQALSAFPSKCLVSPLHTHTHTRNSLCLLSPPTWVCPVNFCHKQKSGPVFQHLRPPWLSVLATAWPHCATSTWRISHCRGPPERSLPLCAVPPPWNALPDSGTGCLGTGKVSQPGQAGVLPSGPGGPEEGG